jgi:hypothetical protein
MFPVAIVLGFLIPAHAPKANPVRAAVGAAVPMLVAGAVGHSDQKTCFACHNQAPPALALSAARDSGFAVPETFFQDQAEHVAEFLSENKDKFRKGVGTGGGAATAGYALFTLELNGRRPDETTAAVVEYLLKVHTDRDHWLTTSDRPPTEASHFTTTYLALRALRVWGSPADRERIEKRTKSAREWLIKSAAKDHEDRVFRLLGLKEVGAGDKEIGAAAWELVKSQRPDGGWGQLASLASDAYATGTALYALHHAGGLVVESRVYQSGVAYLLQSQLPDGTWRVKSRSKPFQPYYESGFPHQKDQFISISASGWATAALAAAIGK